MKRLFQSLSRLLIVALVGVFISVTTFTGEALANNTYVFGSQCNLTQNDTRPAFANPPFAYADERPITLDATPGKFSLDGEATESLYDGYLYQATYYDQSGALQTWPPNNPPSAYNPPTIVVSPGNFIDLTLTNDLPIGTVELNGKLPQTEQNLEEQSQDTNLHYHGFNVSPLLGSDDVTTQVHSNVTQNSDGTPGGIYPFDYPNPTYGSTADYPMQVHLPQGHQSGLFWYHPHVHTVSDNQVRAGMSGGIIVKGIEESYTLLDPDQGIKLAPGSTVNSPAPGTQPETLAITQQVMMFKDFNDVLNPNYVGTNIRPDCFTLNGQLNPQINIQPGEVQFWRIANIGADNYLNLALEAKDDTNHNLAKDMYFYILARDSDVVNKPIKTQSVILPPGGRVELLVVGGNSGQYNLVSDLTSEWVINQKLQQWVQVPNASPKSYYLATVKVSGNTVCYQSPDGLELTPDNLISPSPCKSQGTTLDTYITDQPPPTIDKILPTPLELAHYPYCSVKNDGNDDHNDGNDDHTKCITTSQEYDDPLTQNRYFYFQSITIPSPLAKVATPVFPILGSPPSQEIPKPAKPGEALAGSELYDANRIDKISFLGDNEEWQVFNLALNDSHAFHMHQLDFLVTQVILPDDPGSTYDNYDVVDGKCSSPDDAVLPNGTKGYKCPLQAQGYRDTINLPPNSITTIRIPFLNPFITGVFVYHCHILFHEDNGMMQNLKVIDPKSYQSTSGLGSNS